MKESIVLIGGGGHCASCIDVLEAEGKFEIAGIVDKKEKMRQKVLDCEIMACDEDLPQMIKKHGQFLIAIAGINGLEERFEKFSKIKKMGAKFPVVVSPTASISSHATIEEGTIVMHKALINAGAHIGSNCIINTGAIIEHNVKIGNGCHISTGSIVNGDSSIGKSVFVGSKAVISNGIKVCSHVIIGAGAVVVHSIDKPGTYVGSPAKVTK